MYKHLHLIAFNVPYPANYGGVIDVFCKLKALHAKGVKVILHCFDYGRGEQLELERYAEKVYYYSRKTGWKSQFSIRPYIVESRKNQELLQRLLLDDCPILFEGIHTCGFLSSPLLRGRLKIVRAHNIEHVYYWNLFRSSENWSDKLFFLLESWRLKRYEKVMKEASMIASISQSDTDYFRGKYGNAFYLKPFHAFESLKVGEGHGAFLLYHGNLGVSENEEIALFIIEEIASRLKFPIVIAGANPSLKIIELAQKYEKVQIVSNPDAVEMEHLLVNAHIHLLFSQKSAGVKIKLIESLFTARYCLVNSAVADPLVAPYVHVVDLAAIDQLTKEIERIWDCRMDSLGIDKRREVEPLFSNAKSVQTLLDEISGVKERPTFSGQK